MDNNPLYVSHCCIKSFWHEYRIYADRLELETGVGAWKIPFEQIQQAVVSPPIASKDGISLHTHPLKFGLKLDWADLNRHIMIDKADGMVRRIDFTPEDPDAFLLALNGAMDRRRTGKG